MWTSQRHISIYYIADRTDPQCADVHRPFPVYAVKIGGLIRRVLSFLLYCLQVQWQASWEDEGRRQWHESKMASKVDRAEKQMLALGVKRGLVDHLG